MSEWFFIRSDFEVHIGGIFLTVLKMIMKQVYSSVMSHYCKYITYNPNTLVRLHFW